MIGKSGAQQMINEYLTEVGYFIKNNKRGYNLPSNWKTHVINYINLAAHVVFTNDDAKVEMESPDSQDGLKFTYIRRGLRIREGASIFYNQSDDHFEISFHVSNTEKGSTVRYEKHYLGIFLTFTLNGQYYSLSEEVE